MNTFYEHHKNSIKRAYRRFDRILLNGLIQPFQQPERVIGFFNAYRAGERVTRKRLRDIAQQFQNWVKNRAEKWGLPILEAPAGRRDDFADPYFKQAKSDEVVAILKAREPARIMIAIGTEDRWHLQFAQRWIVDTTFTLTTDAGVACSCESAPICLFQHGSASISTTGWPTQCAQKASILSNVQMPFSNAVIPKSSKSWQIP